MKKGWKKIQLKLLVVKWSEHIIHEVAKHDALSCIEQKKRRVAKSLEPGVSTHCAAARCQAQRRYQATEPGSKEGSEITTKKKNGRTTAATISYNFFLGSRPASRATQWCNQFDNYPWPEFCGQLQWGARFVTARLAAALGVEYWFDWFPFVWESLLRIFCTHPARC